MTNTRSPSTTQKCHKLKEVTKSKWKQDSEIFDNNNNIDCINSDNKNECNEDEGEIPAGITDTMLTPTDFLEDNERQHVLNVAQAKVISH